jgi:hypothetical protein
VATRADQVPAAAGLAVPVRVVAVPAVPDQPAAAPAPVGRRPAVRAVRLDRAVDRAAHAAAQDGKICRFISSRTNQIAWRGQLSCTHTSNESLRPLVPRCAIAQWRRMV